MQGGNKRRKTDGSVWSSERANQLAAEGSELEGAQEPGFDDGLSKEERR